MQHLLEMGLGNPQDFEGFALAWRRVEGCCQFGEEALLQHRLHFARHPGEEVDPAALAHQRETWSAPQRVREGYGALRKQGLLVVGGMHVPPGAGEIGGDHLLGDGAGFEWEAECLGGGAGGEVVVGRSEPSADDQHFIAGSEFTKMACNRFGAIRSAAAFVEI